VRPPKKGAPAVRREVLGWLQTALGCALGAAALGGLILFTGDPERTAVLNGFFTPLAIVMFWNTVIAGWGIVEALSGGSGSGGAGGGRRRAGPGGPRPGSGRGPPLCRPRSRRRTRTGRGGRAPRREVGGDHRTLGGRCAAHRRRRIVRRAEPAAAARRGGVHPAPGAAAGPGRPGCCAARLGADRPPVGAPRPARTGPRGRRAAAKPCPSVDLGLIDRSRSARPHRSEDRDRSMSPRSTRSGAPRGTVRATPHSVFVPGLPRRRSGRRGALRAEPDPLRPVGPRLVGVEHRGRVQQRAGVVVLR